MCDVSQLPTSIVGVHMVQFYWKIKRNANDIYFYNIYAPEMQGLDIQLGNFPLGAQPLIIIRPVYLFPLQACERVQMHELHGAKEYYRAANLPFTQSRQTRSKVDWSNVLDYLII